VRPCSLTVNIIPPFAKELCSHSSKGSSLTQYVLLCCIFCSTCQRTFQRHLLPKFVKWDTKQHTPKGFSRKEVFQPHLPVRLPCYDLAPVTGSTLNGSSRLPPSGLPDFHGLTGGVYKVRERIHRAMADARLLAIPASRGRVADPDPN
jgi:hypothetical protein